MRPLAFLFVHSFKNGAKRALLSPKRSISLLFFALYYFGLLMQPFHRDPEVVRRLPFATTFALPDRYTLDGAVFCLMSAASLIMLTSVLSYRGGFRPADVDVLFPTPISPKVVLAFRVLRDYAITLVLPLLFGVLGYRGSRIGLQALFSNYPARGGDMMRMTWIAWMLLSLAWVAIGYGASLFVGRSDLRSDFNRKAIVYGIASILAIVALYAVVLLRQDLSWQTVLQVTHSVILRIVLLPATAATAVAVGGIEGDHLDLIVGVSVLLALVAAGYSAALSQVDWLYDQAAARGFDSLQLRRMRRGGNQYELYADLARRGKLRRRWLAGRISNLSGTGPSALVWKETLLMTRGPLAGSLIIGLGSTALIATISWAASSNPLVPDLAVIGSMLVLAYIFSFAIGYGGFTEMLRRVDLLKPLPFTAAKTVFWELLAKAPLPCMFFVIGGLVASIFHVGGTVDNLAGVILATALFIEISGAVLLALILFPDYEDPTQRGLTGIVLMLVILVCSSPGLTLFFVMVLQFHASTMVAVFPAALLLIAVTVGLAAIAGSLYAGYNPSE